MRKSYAQLVPERYRLMVRGHLERQWEDLLEGINLDYDKGVTTITGWFLDDIDLYRLIIQIHYLNLALLSVDRIDSN